MKRVVCLLLTLPLVLLLTGCGQSPYALYRAAAEKSAALTEVDCSFSVVRRTLISEQLSTVEYTGTLRAAADDGGAVFAMETVCNDQTLISYYAGGRLYQDNGAEKHAEPYSDERLDATLRTARPLVVDETDILNSDLSSEDGVRVYTAMVSGDKVRELFAADMALGDAETQEKFTFHDMTLRVEISAEGYVTRQVLLYKATSAFMDLAGTLAYECETVFHSPGQPVTVEPPADLEAYGAQDPRA